MEALTTSSTLAFQWLRPWLWYLQPPVTGRSVIAWWEKRRLLYNGFLWAWGILNFFFTAFLLWIRVNRMPKEAYSITSFAGCFFANSWMVVPLVILQITANVWYTGGWVVDLFVHRFSRGDPSRFSQYALAAGTLFSFVFAEGIYIWVYRILYYSYPTNP
jgi:hypothetical protein